MRIEIGRSTEDDESFTMVSVVSHVRVKVDVRLGWWVHLIRSGLVSSLSSSLFLHVRVGSARALRKKFRSQPALSWLARRTVNAVFHLDSLYTNCTYRQWRLVDLY
jgi:hypothetical protein